MIAGSAMLSIGISWLAIATTPDVPRMAVIARMTGTDAATSALNAAKGQQGGAVKDPTTQPSNIGTGGTMLMGNTPDRSKGVVILLFTEGKAFATLEFDGPTDTLAPPDFVNDVGQKQDAAIKKGLGG